MDPYEYQVQKYILVSEYVSHKPNTVSIKLCHTAFIIHIRSVMRHSCLFFLLETLLYFLCS